MNKGFLVTDKPYAVGDVFSIDGIEYRREIFGNVIMDSRLANDSDVEEFKSMSRWSNGTHS
tara:strand:+ start:2407 stop:2589 length:183 start_codon:yes stop_codon:yes gene_type:complete